MSDFDKYDGTHGSLSAKRLKEIEDELGQNPNPLASLLLAEVKDLNQQVEAFIIEQAGPSY